MRALLASPLGLLIGISLGALGGGGSILAVPALVYAAGQTPDAGDHHVARAGRRSRRSSASCPTGAPARRAARGRDLRARRRRRVAARLALEQGRGSRRAAARVLRPDAGRRVRDVATSATHAAAAADGRGEARRTERLAVTVAEGRRRRHARRPAHRVLRRRRRLRDRRRHSCSRSASPCPKPWAPRCSSSRSTRSSRSARACRPATIEWGTVVPFTIASLIGVVIGSRLASTRDSRSLQRWFVGLLVVVAVYTAVHSVLQLV